MATRVLRCGRATLEIGNRTLVMGILNATPDSFSDGGRYLHPEEAVRRAAEMVAQGADLIDVGGESTRPGAVAVSVEEELERVLPVLRALAATIRVPVSIDTYKARVARAAVAAGAGLVNDVWGLQGDPEMARTVAESGVPVVVMHNRREPDGTGDLMAEIKDFLRRSIDLAAAAGVPTERVIVDPGFGFGKTPEQNLELTDRLGEIRELDCPILFGPSRKSTIGKVLDLPVDERVEGTAALVALAIDRGAEIVRVHDIREMARVARMTDAVKRRRQDTDSVTRRRKDPATGRENGPVTAFLGLGSNLGEREDNLREALERLAGIPGIALDRVSSVYETEPFGRRNQPWFLNQVAEIETTLSPAALLKAILAIETAMGRVRRERWGPRLIDIDLLLYGRMILSGPELVLPHPGLRERSFVLVPLFELAPGLILPDGQPLAGLVERIESTGGTRVVRRQPC